MAKVIFVQKELYEYTEVTSLSAILKKSGHKCKLFITDEDKNAIEEVRNADPDMIIFPTTSSNLTECPKESYVWILNVARKFKDLKALKVFSGTHASNFPEIILKGDLDAACIGENEYAVLELADRIQKGEKYFDVQNFWFKSEGKIHKNPVRLLIKDLDDLPFPDRGIYYSKYPFLRNLPTKRFVMSRGCPYQCTFCLNHFYRDMYKGDKYLRRRSVEGAIREIEEVKKKYPLKTVRFVDDVFTLNEVWLEKFAGEYKKRINLPFTCLSVANNINEKTGRLLKEANCTQVNFAVESGVERIRKDVVKKAVTTQKIIECAEILHKNKVKFGIYSMVGLPGESMKDAFTTLELNAKLKPNHVVCTVLQPYPNTEITETLKEMGYLDKSFGMEDIGRAQSTLKYKHPHKKQLENLQKLFYMGVMFPSTIPMIKKLVKLPKNKVYSLVHKFSYWHRGYRSFNLSLFQSLKLGYKLRTRLKDNTKSENSEVQEVESSQKPIL